MNKGYFDSPLGSIKYEYDGTKIYKISFVFDEEITEDYDPKINQSLAGYFNGEVKVFDFDFEFNQKTKFQQEVLKALINIPYGETKSYGEIASIIGRPKAVRAVGQACKSNPIGIMIPCHRVIGKNNQLTGYSGKDYIYLKEKLLKLEKNNK